MASEIKVCMGSACFAKGNQENLELIKEYIEENNFETTVSICGALCENKCANGPRIYVDDVEYQNVTREKLAEILKSLK